MPGQFGPISRVLLPCMARFTLTMSFTGMPSVMQTTRSSPASTASRMASPAKGGGTKIADAVAPVCFAASATVSKIGTLFSKSWPPLPGVTPATICVPYSRLSLVCRAPKLPVMPWTRTLVWGVTRMDMRKLRLAIYDLRVGLTTRVALVNADGIAVRVENHRHAADTSLDRFDAEFHTLRAQVLESLVKVFHFQGGSTAVRIGLECRRRTDGQRIRAKFVFGPLAVFGIIDGRGCQSKHSFVERPSALHVRDGVATKGEF